jgi:hypothetical protein
MMTTGLAFTGSPLLLLARFRNRLQPETIGRQGLM